MSLLKSAPSFIWTKVVLPWMRPEQRVIAQREKNAMQVRTGMQEAGSMLLEL